MRTQVIWRALLLLSIGWIAGGLLLSSDVIEIGSVSTDLSEDLESLAADMNIAVADEFLLPLFFVVTGAPVALGSLLYLRRNRMSGSSSAGFSPERRLRRQTILLTGLALTFALLLWNISDVVRLLNRSGLTSFNALDDLTIMLIGYPVRLFVTFVHEAGHSLAALITGGRVLGFTVSPNGMGYATVAGGNLALVLPAGYLGAALFGSTLFFLTNRIPKWSRGLAIVLGLTIVALTVVYARPDQAGNFTALIIGIGFGLGMIGMGWAAPRVVNVFLLNTLAILTGLNAVLSLSVVVQNPTASSGQIVNDAAVFSREVTPLLPPFVVAVLWAIIAVAMLATAFYFGLVKPIATEASEAVKEPEKRG